MLWRGQCYFSNMSTPYFRILCNQAFLCSKRSQNLSTAVTPWRPARRYWAGEAELLLFISSPAILEGSANGTYLKYTRETQSMKLWERFLFYCQTWNQTWVVLQISVTWAKGFLYAGGGAVPSPSWNRFNKGGLEAICWLPQLIRKLCVCFSSLKNRIKHASINPWIWPSQLGAELQWVARVVSTPSSHKCANPAGMCLCTSTECL